MRGRLEATDPDGQVDGRLEGRHLQGAAQRTVVRTLPDQVVHRGVWRVYPGDVQSGRRPPLLQLVMRGRVLLLRGPVLR